MKKLEGSLDGKGLKIGIVVSRFNDFVTTKLLEGALQTLKDQGVAEAEITVAWVPGSFELPYLASRLAETKTFDAVICFGALIRGETAHFDYIAEAASLGIEKVSRATGVPVIFGVLTCETIEQAMERVGGKVGHKGKEGALAAIEMATLNRKI